VLLFLVLLGNLLLVGDLQVINHGVTLLEILLVSVHQPLLDPEHFVKLLSVLFNFSIFVL